MISYQEFLEKKAQCGTSYGFKPVWMPDFLFGFQSYLADWAIAKGRGLLLTDCGTGKTPIYLTIAENIVRRSNGFRPKALRKAVRGLSVGLLLFLAACGSSGGASAGKPVVNSPAVSNTVSRPAPVSNSPSYGSWNPPVYNAPAYHPPTYVPGGW